MTGVPEPRPFSRGPSRRRATPLLAAFALGAALSAIAFAIGQASTHLGPGCRDVILRGGWITGYAACPRADQWLDTVEGAHVCRCKSKGLACAEIEEYAMRVTP